MARPFPYEVGDVVGDCEILDIYTRTDVKAKRKYCTVACKKCGAIRNNIHPSDLTQGRRTQCRKCMNRTHGLTAVQNDGRSYTREYIIYHNAKKRAKRLGIPFDLNLEDIVIPAKCPLLGIPLVLDHTTMCDDSPSLDKLIPSKGYVRGNILVISMRANRIKQDASIDELMLLTENLHNILVCDPT